mmetsp:Transcript_59794/g.142719  ORF Transcript_59794/g.142719 Transcript_59794/m.142719 type:complete len:249 (+) Transcript_59794:370-1116(+)|eukprot:CAMPEP_0181494284 /NCGR_PEP_ID=MMETSP1110-20121109/51685_1 /TAXON_ID=174948 /ORGANISM="Symbiodinium sp., Strain CCMP421" /LENGTH=248 /DNA_ID=CAMNT_0023621677 /DNA_START=287 /DNA_END=1033 /DNA_ORIENTATION=-
MARVLRRLRPEALGVQELGSLWRPPGKGPGMCRGRWPNQSMFPGDGVAKNLQPWSFAAPSPHGFDRPLSGWGPSPFEPKTKPPDEYCLSLGKITDVLRSDYPDFFTRAPDFSIYDEALTLQLRKPWDEPKQLAGCLSTYETCLTMIRAFSKKLIHDGLVECQVCDGRPYGFDLRVHWTCQGELRLGYRSFKISAISLYEMRKQANRADSQQLAWRIHKHVIDVTEIRPCCLRQTLMNGFEELEMEPAP